MNADDFEKKLQQQRLREIPADWRETILRTARQRATSMAQKRETMLLHAVSIAWRELIQPCRYAWSGMVTLWLIFWMINMHTQVANGPARTATSTREASERIRYLEEQRRVLVELTGPLEFSPAEPSRRGQPKPRSEGSIGIRHC